MKLQITLFLQGMGKTNARTKPSKKGILYLCMTSQRPAVKHFCLEEQAISTLHVPPLPSCIISLLDHSTNKQIKANKQGIVEKFTSIFYILQQQPITQKDIFHEYFVKHVAYVTVPTLLFSGICWKISKKEKRKRQVYWMGEGGIELTKAELILVGLSICIFR